MVKKLKLCLIINLLFLPIYAQTSVDEVYSLAEKLFEVKNYFNAITEYKRAQFFDNENKYTFDSNYKIGLCYKYGRFYENAIRYFSNASKYCKTIDDDFELKIQMIRVNILRKTTQNAFQLLHQLEKDSSFQNKKDEIYYWKGWAYIFNDDWKNAELNFAKSSFGKELYLLSKKVNNQKLSVTFAKVISYILPGSGQIYAGNYLSGLLSFAWNIIAGYFTINSFLQNRAFDGIIIGELVWLRFYKGNVENAEKYSEQKNLLITNNALKFLQEEYKGLIP